MKKIVSFLILVLSISLPSFARVENVRAKELAKKNGIEINIVVNKEINAYADGEQITFYQGLLDNPNLTEDEFLFVLFHEQAHNTLQHPQMSYQLNLILAILSDSIKIDNYLDKAMYQTIIISFNLLQANFTRVQERAADKTATEQLKKLGVGVGACDVFKTVLKDNGRRSPWDTHDISADRFKACEKILAES
jgi:predicted Zn-dependent protease